MSVTANIKNAIEKAEEVRRKYNPDGVSPFPHEEIEKNHSDLKIYFVYVPDDGISGAISYDKDSGFFNVFVNNQKPKTRQNFTLAHELGHYFLHSEIIKTKDGLIDNEENLDSGRILFRLDDAQSSNLEIEANNFAANLIMPKDLVIEAWQKLNRIEDCANIFNVSIIAMSIRLKTLGLLKEE